MEALDLLRGQHGIWYSTVLELAAVFFYWEEGEMCLLHSFSVLCQPCEFPGYVEEAAALLSFLCRPLGLAKVIVSKGFSETNLSLDYASSSANMATIGEGLKYVIYTVTFKSHGFAMVIKWESLCISGTNILYATGRHFHHPPHLHRLEEILF